MEPVKKFEGTFEKQRIERPRTDVRTLEHLFDGCEYFDGISVGIGGIRLNLPEGQQDPSPARFERTLARCLRCIIRFLRFEIWLRVATRPQSSWREPRKGRWLSGPRRPSMPLRHRSEFPGGRGQRPTRCGTHQ